jgi:hypothetical protein
MFKIKYINNINNSSISNSIRIKYSHTNLYSFKLEMVNQTYNNYIILNGIIKTEKGIIKTEKRNNDKYLGVTLNQKYLSNKYFNIYEYGKLCYKESILNSNKINLDIIMEKE